MNISRQTHGLVKAVLDKECVNLEQNKIKNWKEGDEYVGKTLIAYVPHGINHKVYHRIETEEELKALEKVRKELFKEKEDKIKFVLFFNNRNIRRKMIGDLLLAFRTFCEKIGKEKAEEVALVLHTQPIDENGTDITAIIRDLTPNLNIVLSINKADLKTLNILYNIADVTVNGSSNEGFGLTTAESLMAGTPIIVNVTGGLQDQCGFLNDNYKGNSETFLNVNDYGVDEFFSNHNGKYTRHGSWVKPVFPSTRSLQGSVPTPYIFDDRADYKEVAEIIFEYYVTSKADRKAAGLSGREFLMNEEIMMTADKMSENFIKFMEHGLKYWKPRKRLEVFKSDLSFYDKQKPSGV
jgi:hypothetical protein